MLVLSRRVGQKIRIGESIVVTLLKVESSRAKIGVEAPADVPVLRQELFEFARDRVPRREGPTVASETRGRPPARARTAEFTSLPPLFAGAHTS